MPSALRKDIATVGIFFSLFEFATDVFNIQHMLAPTLKISLYQTYDVDSKV